MASSKISSEAALLEDFVVGRPVPGIVDQRNGSAHVDWLPCWIHEMIPRSFDYHAGATDSGKTCFADQHSLR
jgi:hypothetical protein